jgi:hypothetical protein
MTTPDTSTAAVERFCAAVNEGPNAKALVRALLAECNALRAALVKVRAHTSYTHPDRELLTGLLASIERIADAALEPPS